MKSIPAIVAGYHHDFNFPEWKRGHALCPEIAGLVNK
jgi:hypothetical protein